MTCPIDPNVKIAETDTRVHIGVTVFPLATRTIRFTPLTEEGREILKIGTDRLRVSTSLERGYEIADWLGSTGVATCEEILVDLDDRSRFVSKGYLGSSGYDGENNFKK